MTALPHIFELTPDALALHVKQMGLPAYRSDQIIDWVYQQHVIDPQQMTNLSKLDRKKLQQNIRWLWGHIAEHQVATDGVQKLLIDWAVEKQNDANPAQGTSLPIVSNPAPTTATTQTECVLIPTAKRDTACISSQVGCPVGCHFCASGLDGLDGNLSAGQIVQQVWQLAQLTKNKRISNVVFMGMGEPLANFEPVAQAVKLLTASWGLNLSARKITVSTVGLPAQIKRLAHLHIPVTLAISLHAPTDDLRKQLIPWADHVSIAQIIQAGQYYFEKTGREVTLEYILLSQVNDQPEHAHQLASQAKKLRANINLIGYNPVASLPFAQPKDEDVRQFLHILQKAGINTHLRASRGKDIAAACGQLRHQATHTP